MTPDTKLATCCYCGARTVLKPTARDGHELACGSCGAPLHEMKWLRAPASPTKSPSLNYSFKQKKPKTAKPQKRKKSGWHIGLKKAWDIIEDIVD